MKPSCGFATPAPMKMEQPRIVFPKASEGMPYDDSGRSVPGRFSRQRIEDDIGSRLVVPRQIHRKLVEVVNGNLDHIERHAGWHFVDFVRQGYVAQVAVGIRRHVKSKDDSVSLMR